MTLYSSNVTVVLAIFSYIVFVLFSFTSPRRAIGTIFVLGVLFLPVFEYKLPHIPALNKSNVIGLLVVIFTFLYDRNSWRQFKFRWFDIPVLLSCCSPIFSSLSNELGLKDGVFISASEFMLWGVPYLVGRAYFSSSRQSRNLSLGIFVGGLLYIPFCLYEIRMSPILHKIIYGYSQHSFAQTIRFDGFRPMVFMNHGLMVAMWMSIACLNGFWLWKLKLFRGGEAMLAKFCLVLLFVTTVLLKSSGALILLFVGVCILAVTKKSILKYFILVFLAVPFVYILASTSGYWTGKTAVDLAANYLGPDRAQSLAFRLSNEEMLIRKTMERPLFGWGGWGRGKVYDEEGKDITITDSLWIITFNNYGFWGTFWLYFALVLPSFLFLHRKIQEQGFVSSAPIAVLCIGSLLYVLDTLLNNMPNPIYMIMAGAVNGMQREQEMNLSENKSQRVTIVQPELNLSR